MQFKLTITTDNAAFESPNGSEIARILRELANKIDNRELDNTYATFLRDSNGNITGKATHA